MACTVSCNTIKLAGTEVTHSSSEGASSRGQACTPNSPPTQGYLHSQLPRSISTSLCYSHPNTKVRNTLLSPFLSIVQLGIHISLAMAQILMSSCLHGERGGTKQMLCWEISMCRSAEPSKFNPVGCLLGKKK